LAAVMVVMAGESAWKPEQAMLTAAIVAAVGKSTLGMILTSSTMFAGRQMQGCSSCGVGVERCC
jgi:hypothetical protein